MEGEMIYTGANLLSYTKKECFTHTYLVKNTDNGNSFPFTEELLKNHRKCPYWTLLYRLCPSVFDSSSRTIGNSSKKISKMSSKNLIANFSTTNNVFLFIRRILIKLLPSQLLHTQRNLNSFLKQVKLLVSLPKYSKISVELIIEGIQTKSIPWLHDYDETEQREKLKQAVHYVTSKIVFPLVQSFFYVVESTSFKNRLFFFRKKTWFRLVDSAKNKFITLCGLRKVEEHWVAEKMKIQKCLGVANVRFFLKKSGLRPVVNMSSHRKGTNVSINMHLKALLLILKFEKESNPNQQLFGATIMGVNDIYFKYKMFLNNLKFQTLYFVKVDIENCFNTINICLLYGIVERILKRKYYNVYKYKKTRREDGKIKTIYFDSLKNSNQLSQVERTSFEILGSYVLTKEVLLDKLSAHLFCNVVKLGKQHYVQTQGISQGSSLSSILCGAYYGYLEWTFLHYAKGKQDLFIRMADDILFVTGNKTSAESFLKIFLDGIPEFNFRVNMKKSCVNFDFTHPVFGKVPNVSDSEDGFMKFCGLAINTTTHEVCLDFSNYVGISTKDTISWDFTQCAEISFKKKILMTVCPNCMPILFDPKINSEKTIYYNLMCIFALSAIKFHCLNKYLPIKNKVISNPTFFASVIQSLPKKLLNNVSRKICKIDSPECHYEFPAPVNIVSTICFHVFLYKLKRHHQMYQPVIEILTCRIRKNSADLDKEILAMLPEVFENIYIK